MKTKLIVNPASGQENALGYLPAINARLREDGDVDIVLTTGDGDGVEAGRRAALEGYDRVFVAGGDGTLNEVLNGLAQVDGALARITLARGAVGDGQRLRYGDRRPRSRRKTRSRHCSAARPHPSTSAASTIGCFLNVSAGGFIADVSDAVNPQLKTVLGKLAYLVGGAQVLLDYEPVAARIASAADTRARLAAHVRRVQFTADRRRPPDRAARRHRRRLARRLPDRTRCRRWNS